MSRAELPEAVREATERQPGARAALAAALAAGPSHAYLFAGPAIGSMRAAARAFAAELLAERAPDPASARARALADPSPHPDLVWLVPPGGQHLVDEVRERVIKAASYRPFEGERRVFVIEAAEAMADESQNALLKTLEEPPAFAHLLLLSAEPAGLRETVISRCQRITFQPLAPEGVEEWLAREHGATGPDARAAARLCGGDPERARFLLSDRGGELRAAAQRLSRDVRAGALDDAPWLAVLELAEREGEAAAHETLERELARAEAGDPRPATRSRARRDAEAAAKRAGRRRRTDALDLALRLCGIWFRDLAAVGEGAEALHVDRRDELREDAEGLDPRRARRAAELVLETQRRLTVNVSEELALEALSFRAAAALRGDAVWESEHEVAGSGA